MKNTFLKIASRNAAAANKTNRKSTPPDQVRSVGVLFTSANESKADAINRFVQQLEKEGKSVILLEFRPLNKTKSTEDSVFSLKDLSFFGSINHTGCTRFMNQEFDYLFFADTELQPATQLILAGCKARCRVGIASPELQPALDLMMNTDGTWGGILDELLSLTRKLS